jgi:hypothetical protein
MASWQMIFLVLGNLVAAFGKGVAGKCKCCLFFRQRGLAGKIIDRFDERRCIAHGREAAGHVADPGVFPASEFLGVRLDQAVQRPHALETLARIVDRRVSPIGLVGEIADRLRQLLLGNRDKLDGKRLIGSQVVGHREAPCSDPGWP